MEASTRGHVTRQEKTTLSSRVHSQQLTMKFNAAVSGSRRKCRKAHFSAPSHIRRKVMSASLSKDLRLKFGVSSLPPQMCRTCFGDGWWDRWRDRGWFSDDVSGRSCLMVTNELYAENRCSSQKNVCCTSAWLSHVQSIEKFRWSMLTSLLWLVWSGIVMALVSCLLKASGRCD